MGLSTEIALGAVKVQPGGLCAKVGVTQSVNGKIYTCIKTTKGLRWDNGTTLKPSEPKPNNSPKESTPSPTSSPIAILPITPIVSLCSRLKGPETFGLAGCMKIYLEYQNYSSNSRYFLVVSMPAQGFRGFPGMIGNESGIFPIWMGTKDALVKASQGLFNSSRYLTGEISHFPINAQLDPFSAPTYDVAVFQTPKEDTSKIIGISPILRVVNSNYTDPTPTPTPVEPALTVILGQVCAPEGVKAKLQDGTPVSCLKSVSDGSLRWAK